MNQQSHSNGNRLQLMLGTGAFALCFAVFGSVSAMMPILKKQLHLDPVQVSIAIAVPVLLGSLGRIPLGMLTDRFGGRLIFSRDAIDGVMVEQFTKYRMTQLEAFARQIDLVASKGAEGPKQSGREEAQSGRHGVRVLPILWNRKTLTDHQYIGG